MARSEGQPAIGVSRTVRLCVPGLLEYRDLAIRVVAAACKLATHGGRGSDGDMEYGDLARDFDNQVISAFSEAYNNIALHAYGDRPTGTLEMEVEFDPRGLTIRIYDYGASFDLTSIPLPDFVALPESGFGLFIIRSFMDEVTYRTGSPNVLSMSKWYKSLRQPVVSHGQVHGSQGGSVR